MYRNLSGADFLFLLVSLKWTVLLSLIAIGCGAVVGLALALMRISNTRFLPTWAAIFIRLNQGIPLLVQLFLVFFGLSFAGIQVSSLTAASLCFTLNAGAFFGEAWRGCIQAIPRGQAEAAAALGLKKSDTYIYVILPQAAKIALGPTVACLVYIIKGTSLASLIGFVELSRAGQIINSNTSAPFTVFGMVAALYLCVCWPLSILSDSLERRYINVR